MKLKFHLTENVVMTDQGLMKRCLVCREYYQLQRFPDSRTSAWKRKDICHNCIKLENEPIIGA